jgi:hypothetical protein
MDIGVRATLLMRDDMHDDPDAPWTSTAPSALRSVTMPDPAASAGPGRPGTPFPGFPFTVESDNLTGST